MLVEAARLLLAKVDERKKDLFVKWQVCAILPGRSRGTQSVGLAVGWAGMAGGRTSVWVGVGLVVD